MTKKRLNFCFYYLETRNARESAKLAGFSLSYSNKQAHLLLRNDEIKEKITYFEEKFYQDEFKKLSIKAVKKLNDILSSTESESVQLGAVKLALELAGVSERENSTQSISIKVQLPNDL